MPRFDRWEEPHRRDQSRSAPAGRSPAGAEYMMRGAGRPPAPNKTAANSAAATGLDDTGGCHYQSRVAGTLPAGRNVVGVSADARILAVATAVPPYALGQSRSDAANRLMRSARAPAKSFGCFPCSAIRASSAAIRAFRSSGTKSCTVGPNATRVYLESAVESAGAATRDALQRAGRDAGRDRRDRRVSTTGIATPSLDALLMERMRLRRDRAPIADLRSRLCRRHHRLGARRFAR